MEENSKLVGRKSKKSKLIESSKLVVESKGGRVVVVTFKRQRDMRLFKSQNLASVKHKYIQPQAFQITKP